MNFDSAWEKRAVGADRPDKGEKRHVCRVTIFFGSGMSATMDAAGYFACEEDVKAMLKRAWETYCIGKHSVQDSIREIRVENIEEKAPISRKKTA